MPGRAGGDIELSTPQQRVVEQVVGPLLVIAGAGGGKTMVLTKRIANIIQKGLASPHSVLAVTFTRRAAWEMRSRLRELLGPAADFITVSTFHSLGFRLLAAEGAQVGFDPKRIRVVDKEEAALILQRAVNDAQLPPRIDVANIGRAIERAKDELLSPEHVIRVPGDFYEEALSRVYRRYQELLQQQNAVDYGDLIALPVAILQRSREALEFYRSLYRFISVDEFQDTSRAQYQLMHLLGGGHRNVCVVGSPVQSIYSWRGAYEDIFSRFRQDFPEAVVIPLWDNYRCREKIVAASQAVVQSLPYADIGRPTQAGGVVRLFAAQSELAEARRVGNEIRRLSDRGERYEDIAVLYRTKFQGRVIEQVLLELGIPYIMIGDREFFKRREIRDALAYLRLCYDFTDAIAFQRIVNSPPRGLGRAAQEKLRGQEEELSCLVLNHLERRTDLPPAVREAAGRLAELLFNDIIPAAKHLPLVSLLEHILQRTGYYTWLEKESDTAALGNLRLLKSLCERYTGPDALGAFLADVAGMDDGDLPRTSAGVTLATIHAVKGMEFPIVFVIGMEDGVFPHIKSIPVQASLEEEQRLVYVAMTRAERELYLSWARTRVDSRGREREQTPSRFLSLLPRDLVEVEWRENENDG